MNAAVNPDSALWELRALLAAYRAPGAHHAHQADRAERIAELAEDLDGWLSGGGYLPEPWRRAHPAARRLTVRQSSPRPPQAATPDQEERP